MSITLSRETPSRRLRTLTSILATGAFATTLLVGGAARADAYVDCGQGDASIWASLRTCAPVEVELEPSMRTGLAAEFAGRPGPQR